MYRTQVTSVLKNFVISNAHPRIVAPQGSYVDFFYDSVDKFAQKTAIVDPSTKRYVTYADLKRQTNGVASGLAKRGFQPGQIMGIFGSNCMEFCPIWHGTMAAGGAAYVMKPVISFEEMVYQLCEVRPRFLTVTADRLDLISKAAKEVNSIEDIFVVGSAVENYQRVDDLINDSGDASPWGQVEIDSANDVGVIMQTSGTTGMSKNVLATHDGLKYSNIMQEAGNFSETDSDLCLGYVPFAHSISVLIIHGLWFLRGCGIVTVNGFDPDYFLHLIDEYKITQVPLTPASAAALAYAPNFKDADLSSWRCSSIGGAALNKEKEKHFYQTLHSKLPQLSLIQGYGITEAVSALTFCPPKSSVSYDKPGTVGIPVPNVEIKVVRLDDPTTGCNPNEPGEIYARSPSLMKGYLNNETETKKVLRDGWYITGDYGWFDEDGYIWIIDRISDLIRNKSGVIVPAEMESVLIQHPDVEDCVVIGIPHEELGEVAKAFVISKSNISEADIQNFVAERMKPHQRLLGGVSQIESIPKSPAGKVLRRQLKV